MSPVFTQQSVGDEAHLVDQQEHSYSESHAKKSGAITTQNLTFHYPNCEPVLDNVSLFVHKGQRIGIIGHNGCGKTTLFMLLCGVLSPTAGEIFLLDQPVKPGEFRPEVAMLFQDPDDQLFSPTVREDIAFGPQNMGLDPEATTARVNKALAITGTDFLADRTPHHLSGGEKQMVAIAGLLAMHPEVVLLDEPTASLDMRTRRRLISFLQRSAETMLISSHDLEFVLEVCDRVILVDNGQIIADGDPLDIMGDQALMEEHGLEKPHSLIPHVRPHHRRLSVASRSPESHVNTIDHAIDFEKLGTTKSETTKTEAKRGQIKNEQR
ncbi:ABC transporter, ATP-binding protein [Synechococcus sp. PCC 7335]|nr:energy-coupling factor ABC transporter ATP-binding protein [Synechococcus sp. PCC 7335]EDX87333.1 ABC transporter, ATP-binding protein [Synechococcus sp. PCC 7335]